MIYYQKNHWYVIIITFFHLIKRSWPFLVFITIKSADFRIQIFILMILAILIFSIMRWKSSFIIIADDYLTYRNGVIIKEDINIPINSISLVELEKNIFHSLLGVTKVQIDSLAPSKDKSKVVMILKKSEILNLSKNLSAKMKNLMTYRDEKIEKEIIYKLSFKHLILLSTLRSNIILGLFFLYSTIHAIGKVRKDVNSELKNFLVKIFIEEPSYQKTLLSIIFYVAIALTILISVILFFSVLATISKFYRFKIHKKGNYIRVEYGLFTRKSYSILAENIHAIKIEQNLINQFLNLYTIKCCVVGYGDNIKEDEIIFPLCDKKSFNEIINNIVPEFVFRGETNIPRRDVRSKFFTMPLWTTSFLCLVTYIITRKILIAIIPLPIVVFNRFLLYKNTMLGFNNNLFFISYKAFNKKTFIVRSTSIEEVIFKSNPFQRKKDVGNFNFKFYSQKKSEWITLKNLDYKIYNDIKIKNIN